MRSFIFVIAIFVLTAATITSASPALALVGPTLSGPASGSGGSTVTITGFAPCGQASAGVTVNDDSGPVPADITWTGNKLEIRITLPAYNPKEPDNVVTVRLTCPSGSTTHDISVTQ